jgi:hypothetical protein
VIRVANWLTRREIWPGKQKDKRMLKNESANDGIYDLPSGAVTAIVSYMPMFEYKSL